MDSSSSSSTSTSTLSTTPWYQQPVLQPSSASSVQSQPHHLVNIFRNICGVADKFKIPFIIVREQDSLEETLQVWAQDKRRKDCTYISFDMESFQNKNLQNIVALAQIMVDSVVFVAPPSKSLAILKHFIDAKTSIVVAGRHSDEEALGLEGIEFFKQYKSKIVDLQVVAQEHFSIFTTNLSFLSFHFLGAILSKSGKSWKFDWNTLTKESARDYNTYKKLQYAISDAFCTLTIYQIMLELIRTENTR
jgi:hypothetical protein